MIVFFFTIPTHFFTPPIQCTAASSSLTPVTFQWKKDDILISDGPVDNYASTDDDDDSVTRFTTILHLLNIRDEDSGLYQCVISNQFGASYSKRANVNVYTFPVFKKVPVDVTVKTGSMARLECAADGRPAPEIAWQKDGGHDFPAARDRRMHVQSTDEQVFFITNVKTVDEGVYSCTASNEAGTIVANASLSVLEIPFFVKPMHPQRIHRGATAVLECLSGGSPRPKVTWLRNDEPLELTARHFLTGEDQILLITDTTYADAGRYTCVISNTLGQAREEARLDVMKGPGLVGSSAENPADHADDATSSSLMETKGIVVIAVVVCIVGTSFIWVLVIYVKTRLRGAGRNVPVMAKFGEASGGSIGGSADSRSQCSSSGGARSSLVGRGSTGSTSGGTSGNGSHSHVQHHPSHQYDGKRRHRSPGPFVPGSYDEAASSPVAPLAWNYGGDVHESRPELRRHSSGTTIHSHAASAPQYVVGGGCGETFSKGSEMELLDTVSPESTRHPPPSNKQPPLRVAEDTSKFSHHGAVTVHVLRQEAALATVSKSSPHQHHSHIYASASTLPPPSPQQLRRTAPPSPLPPLHRLVEEGSSLNRFDTSIQSSIDVPSASTQMTSCDELAPSGERTIDDDDEVDELVSSLTSSVSDPPFLREKISGEAMAADSHPSHPHSSLSASPSATSSPLVIPRHGVATNKSPPAPTTHDLLVHAPQHFVAPPVHERPDAENRSVVVPRRPLSETMFSGSLSDHGATPSKAARVTSCAGNYSSLFTDPTPSLNGGSDDRKHRYPRNSQHYDLEQPQIDTLPVSPTQLRSIEVDDEEMASGSFQPELSPSIAPSEHRRSTASSSLLSPERSSHQRHSSSSQHSKVFPSAASPSCNQSSSIGPVQASFPADFSPRMERGDRTTIHSSSTHGSSPPPLPEPAHAGPEREASSPSQCPFPGPNTSVEALPPRPLPLLPAMLPRPDSEAVRDSLIVDGAVGCSPLLLPTRDSTLESFPSSASRYGLGADTSSSSSSFDVLSSPSGAAAASANVTTGILPDSLLLRAAATAALRGRSNSSGSRSPGGSIGGILSPVENCDNSEDV